MKDGTTMDDHDRWTDRLSEHVDGSLDAEESRRVERHLEGCEACRRVVEDLRAIRAAAAGLPDLPPSRDLWPDIRRAVLGADVIPLDGAAPRAPRRAQGLFLSFRQLAAAAAGLLLVGSAAGWALTSGAPAPADVADTRDPSAAVRPAGLDPGAIEGPGAAVASSYAEEVDRLESLLAASRDRLEPGTVRVLEKNLAAIDRAIAESMTALASDPANAWVREHLRRSWERKVDYLREAADLAEWSEAD